MAKNKESKDDKQNIKWIISAIRPHWGGIFILSLVIIATQIDLIADTYVMKLVIDGAVAGDAGVFKKYLIVLLILLAAFIVLTLLTNYLQERVKGQITLLFQKRLFRTLLAKDYHQVTEKHSGEWMNRIVTDSETVSKSVIDTYATILTNVVDSVGSTVVLFMLVPVVTLALVAASIVIGFVGFLLRAPFKARQHKLRKSEGRERIFFTERIAGLLIIKAFSKEEEELRNADKEIKKVFERLLHKIRLSAGVKTGFQTAKRILFLGVLITCAYELYVGKISFGTFATVQRLIFYVRDPLMNIGSYITSYYELSVSAERLREPELYKDDYDGHVMDEEEIHSFYDDRLSDIRMDNVAFRYMDRRIAEEYDAPRVFQNVDLTIPKGSMTAVTGITGSGKSTLFKLLMSLYPLDEGEITVNTVSGESYPLDASFRRFFSYVPQGDQLMMGSIREIITFGTATDSTKDDQIWAALEQACAKDFVEGLADGLDTEIKEKGLGLSGGQLQRLAIARALYTDRPILLLDEATSSLDEETEEKLLTNIDAMENRTVLIATHRPRVLSICDSEIHIENDVVTMKRL